MKIKHLNFVISFFFFVSILNAQNTLSLEDVIYGGKNFNKFLPENKDYRFVGGKDDIYLIERDSVTSIDKEGIVINLQKINSLLSNEGLDSLQSLHQCNWLDDNLIWFKMKNRILMIALSELKIKTIIEIPENAEFLDFSPEEKRVVYLDNKDLYIKEETGDAVKIESASEKDIVLGKSVHRNEFGIRGGVFTSPKGNFLAFYRKDESMVKDYPLVDITTREAEVKNIKYPMAGMASHEVTLGVYNFKTGKLIYLKTQGSKDHYLTNVAWSPDEKYITIAELNREQDDMKFNIYNPESGAYIKTVFEEKSDKWVEPEHKPLFFTKNPNLFLWLSERDGYNHIYLYDINKGLQKQLTKGEYVVTEMLGLRKNDSRLFFESTKDGYLDRNLYELNINNGKIQRITSSLGYHICELSSSGDNVLDRYSSLDIPGKINLIDVKTHRSKLLFEAKNPFIDYNIGKVSLGTLKSADQKTDLSYRMVLPADFDSTKRYRVVIYVYGGPHSQMVKNSWLGGVRLWQIYMSQLGYISFTMDNRGTDYRGCDFEKVIHRQLGVAEAKDQYEGIRFLQSLPYVDSTRIGVHGWSFGGFMTINLMEKYPNDIKVGVCGGPVIDWKYYEVMYGERYMDMPQENPDGYAMSNLNNRVDSIKGKLLIIHGAIDPTVVWQNSLSFIEECIEHRIQVDYFVYPRHEHNVLGPDRVHLMQKVTQYFEDYL